MYRIIIGVFALSMAVGCDLNKGQKMEFTGTLEMTEHLLGARVAGRIVTLSVEEGDAVKAGQLIATLDRYDQTKKDLERQELLLKSGGVNAQAVEYAKLAMEDQEVLSPIDGIVLVKVRQVGEVVGPGASVVVIGDPKDQWVRIFVPEGSINRIQKGAQATLVFDGIKKVYGGHVGSIGTNAEFTPRNVQTPEERATQNFAVKVNVDDADVPAHAGVAANVKFENL